MEAEDPEHKPKGLGVLEAPLELPPEPPLPLEMLWASEPKEGQGESH